MNEQRKLNLSTKVNAHWSKIRAAAAVLDVDKMVVKRHWNKLKGSIDGIINGHELAVERAKAVIHDPQPKLFAPRPEPEELKPRSMIEALGLAFWFIKKVGDLETAKRAIKAAIHAVEDVS